ncbi:c-type cytochrome [Parahaliea maris]|uniref:C-type cytochrome n=1 Tax=Parahaliea maris TaxID=2716870 RepID=A0A5C8ZYS9_9GAMM|nr:c-type cytochrome [Parahaliea maris]TXS92894.1 c-type cytochrome [Parahaliea maris]
MAGDDQAISPLAREGFVLFTGKAGCADCHSGWRFTDDTFHDVGLPAPEDTGRYRFSREPGDRFAFKTPGLRNLASRAPYMHNGSMNTLDAVIRHYNGNWLQRPTLSPLLRDPHLSEDDITALLSFLDSLNSDGGTQVPDTATHTPQGGKP